MEKETIIKIIPDEIKLRELEIELEKLKIKKQGKMHLSRMEELKLRLKIAEIYRCKTGKKRILKKIKKEQDK